MLVSTAALILIAAPRQVNPTDNSTARVVINSHVFTADGKAAKAGMFYLVAYGKTAGRFVAEKGRIGAGGEVSVNHLKKEGEAAEMLVVRCSDRALYFQEASAVTSEIHLTAGTSAAIVITLPSGAPAANLTVVPKVLISGQARTRSVLWFPSDLASDFAVRTDAAGKCVFVDLPAGRKLSFDVPDDRFQQIGYEDQIELKQGKPSVKQLALKTGASITGHLTREGSSVAGVAVTAQSIGFPGNGWGSATTDDQGAFKMSRLGPGTYNVSLNLNSPMSDDWTGPAKEVSVQQGETKTGVDLKLEKGSLVVGHVVNEQGKPEKDIWIGIYGPAHPQTSGAVQSVQTDVDGAYRLRVPPGDQFVYVMVPGGKNQTVTVNDGGIATADFEIRTPGKDMKIAGIVKNERGEPVPNAVVDVAFEGSDPGLDLLQVTADSGGRFSVVKPSQAEAATIYAHTATLGSSAPVVTKTSDEISVTIKAHQLASASGSVLDPAGKTISGANIAVYMSVGNHGNQIVKLSSGPDGRFLIKDLFPACEYNVWITAPGFGEARVDQLTPLPGEAVDLKQFHLPRADSFLAGIVKDEQGVVVPGATVGTMDLSIFPVTTDGNGKFQFNGIPKGAHRMYVERGRLHADFELVAGKKGQVVVLSSHPELGLPVVTSDAQEPAPILKIGSPALELETSTWLNSKPLKLGSLRGKIVVLDFWGIWCGPCVKALPGVEKLARKFGGQVVVIGIHDSTGVASKMAAFAKTKGLTYALTIDRKTLTQTPGVTALKYHVGGFPFLIIIDKNGKVVATPPTPERAATMIAHLLKS
jgi:thiol-disulfide isomerase/thioredoxin